MPFAAKGINAEQWEQLAAFEARVLTVVVADATIVYSLGRESQEATNESRSDGREARRDPKKSRH